jgi:hypothetical protein
MNKNTIIEIITGVIFFAIALGLMFTVKMVLDATREHNEAWVEGVLVDTYQDTYERYVVLETVEHNNEEIVYYRCHVPAKYLTKITSSNPERKKYEFNIRKVPADEVHWEFSHTVLK